MNLLQLQTVASYYYIQTIQAAGFRLPHKTRTRTVISNHMVMAVCRRCSNTCLLSLILLFSVSNCTSGTILSYAYDASGITTTSSSLKLNQVVVHPSQIRVLVTDFNLLDTLSKSNHGSSMSVQIYLNSTHLGSANNKATSSEAYLLWLKMNLKSYISQKKVNIDSLTVSTTDININNGNELQQFLSTLKTTHSILTSLKLQTPVKLYVALPLSELYSLTGNQKSGWDQILRFIRSTGSSLVLEHHTTMTDDKEPSLINRHQFVHSMISKARVLASSSILNRGGGVPIILSMNCDESLLSELPLLHAQIMRSLERYPQISDKITELQLRVSSSQNRHNLPRRELNSRVRTTRRDGVAAYDPSAPITNPATTPTTTIPTYNNPTPGIVTIPGTNPDTTGGGTPSTTVPVTVPPPVTPVSTTAPNYPITNPVPSVTTNPGTTGVQPVTNPVTTYPAPATGTGGTGGTGTIPPPTTTYPAPATTTGGGGTIPPANPVTATPMVGGSGSWCVAKSGIDQTILQSGLDYACGNGADCSMIQQGASCYDPNTLQNHASYAFNSYFQKNPVSTSCDFGGAAAIVSTNPSSGSCTYPSSSSSGSTVNPSMGPPGTSSTTGVTGSSGTTYQSPSYIPGSNNPMSPSSITFGSQSPSITTAPSSGSHHLRPHDFLRFVKLVASVSAGVVLLGL